MLGAAVGLTEVRTEDLKKLLGLAHRGEASYPLNAIELARLGLQHSSAELLGGLRGLNEAGVKAVLVAVIAERLPANAIHATRRNLRP